MQSINNLDDFGILDHGGLCFTGSNRRPLPTIHTIDEFGLQETA
jgi:hypothetical protein